MIFRTVLLATVLTIIPLHLSADTPRQQYLQSFNFYWDMKSVRPLSRFDAPFFGNFELYQPGYYYDCIDHNDPFVSYCDEAEFRQLTAEDFASQESISEWAIGDMPWFTIHPYQAGDLLQNRADWAYVPMCSGTFNTLPDGFVFSVSGEFSDTDISEFVAEVEIAESTYTRQFLDYIGADQQLRHEIQELGLLTTKANEYFYQAWINGRLRRPALAYVVGECGDGGNEVTISFFEPTVRFQIIPVFDFQLCTQMGLDPWNSKECSHVRDQLSDLQVLSGRYRSRITRKSGEVLYRDIDINHSTDTEIKL